MMIQALRENAVLFSYKNTAIRGGQQIAAAQNRDWPEKKDSVRKEHTMLDWLKEILGESWTEEIDKKVSDEIGKGFVSRSDFNTKNEELKTAKSTLKERDGQLEQLKNPDVLMIPVGGFYTIDADQAKQIADQLNARLILPMHYKTEYNQEWPISGPEAFLELYDTKEICQGAEAVRVTKEDMECQAKVMLFSVMR